MTCTELPSRSRRVPHVVQRNKQHCIRPIQHVDIHATPKARTVLTQLQAVAPYPVHGVVRTVSDDPALLKQYLDIGAQTVLVAMVETAGRAARAC